MKKSIAVLLCACFVFPGCSAFRSSTQTMSVTTDQPDAQIYVNGAMAGTGTASASVKRNENVQLMVTKAGYITVQRSIGKSLNTTGVLDIIGGCLFLIPFFGRLAAGSQSLDETNVNVMMMKA
jgi:hypothetical protein